MKCEWKRCTIGDLGRIITGKTPNTKVTEYWDGNIPFVTPKDLQGTKHIDCTERSITSNGLDAVKGSTLPANSVCVSCIGNIGYTGITTQICVTNQQINTIVVNKFNNFDFVYYLLRNLWSYFKNYEGQSTTLSILNKTQFSKIGITIPDLETQKKIAKVLSALDDKIELNNQINKNLEEQAQALYNSWFVEFEPFGGVVPADWAQADIYSLAEVIYGAPFASKYFNNTGDGIPIIRIRDLEEQKFITYTTEKHSKGYLLQKGDIVVGMDGEFRPYIWGNSQAWLNQRVCVFKNKRPNGKAFLYYTIKPLLLAIEQTQVATTVIHIGKKDFDLFKVTLPANEILDKFDNITTPIIDQIVQNTFENKILCDIRETLLPKLMSGEIDVDNVEI